MVLLDCRQHLLCKYTFLMFENKSEPVSFLVYFKPQCTHVREDFQLRNFSYITIFGHFGCFVKFFLPLFCDQNQKCPKMGGFCLKRSV